MSLHKIKSVRWVFDCCAWEPTLDQVATAVAGIQIEEKTRIGRFVFKRDAKMALAGRLLIRKFVNEATLTPWRQLYIDRDAESGKPYWKDDKNVLFNVSHNGRFAVLAGEVGGGITQLGVDVMRRRYTGGKSIDEFFRLMNRHFSFDEWLTIRENHSDMARMEAFYRFWCLKESYVKATGSGVTVDLQRISFRVNSDLYPPNGLSDCRFVEDTELFLDGVKVHDWLFQEALLDDDHCVAVGLKSGNVSSVKGRTAPRFVEVNFDQLTENCESISTNDVEYCKHFLSKE